MDWNAINAYFELLVEVLQDRYPMLDLSFGYIGNLERWGDNRVWKIFSKNPGRSSDGFRLGCGLDLSDLLKDRKKLEASLDSWCQEKALMKLEGRL